VEVGITAGIFGATQRNLRFFYRGPWRVAPCDNNGEQISGMILISSAV
jgi:hypothetical protein